jgi:hypothetical protein
MERICPLPTAWNRIYNYLVIFRQEQANFGITLSEIPIPLILAGWVYSNDYQKRTRWVQMVNWAEGAGCYKIISTIEKNEWYLVENASSYGIGPLGGPMYSSWDMTLKPRASKIQRLDWLRILEIDWKNIAGSILFETTIPMAITGSKGRRLVVEIKQPMILPPWGSWEVLPNDSRRSAFREFRKRVNTSLYPHVIDHIDFFKSFSKPV